MPYQDRGKTDNQLQCLFRIGEVSSVDPAKGTARAVFDEEDGIVSYDLPVMQKNTLENADYWMPDIGEDVLCIFNPTAEEDGFILGSFYAGEITPPAGDIDVRMVKFADGTTVSYNRKSHTLNIKIDGTEITADRNTVDIRGAQTVNIESATAINIRGTQTVNIESASAVNIRSAVITLTMGGTTMRLDGGNAVIDTEKISFTGDGQFYGNLKVNGDLRVDGTVLASGSIREKTAV